jgi:xylobiose transport system substrate-binding protein
MGSWAHASATGDPAFLRDGLGYAPFPSVEGGSGDPGDLVGNVANYFSVSSGGNARAA